MYHHHTHFPIKISVHSQAPVPMKHYSSYRSYHWLCQSRCCLQWCHEGNVEVDDLLALRTGLLWMKVEQERREKLGVVFWAINLLNPTPAVLIICRMLSTRFRAISQLSIKPRWHLLSCWPFSLRCNTDCHYRRTHILPAQSQLSFSSRIHFKWQQAYLSVCVYFTYEFMYGCYWCVKAAGVLACFRYDMSCVW